MVIVKDLDDLIFLPNQFYFDSDVIKINTFLSGN